MNYQVVDVFEERLLLVTPSSRDADDACQVLTQAGICVAVVNDLLACCQELHRGVGAVVIVEEAMVSEDVPELLHCLGDQPAWSDVPIVLLTGRDAVTSDAARFLSLFKNSGNVTMLERPFRVNTLISTLRVALRARHRQYQVRDLLIQLESEKDRLEDRVKERTRELNRTVRFLEQFTFSMAHDLRAPLRAMRSYTGILREEYAPLLDKQGQAFVGKVDTAAEKLDTLINDLLALARMSSLQVPLLSLSVDSVIDSVLYAFEEEIRRTGAVVEKKRSDLKALANPVILKQVLENFLGNALKYSEPRGQPEIHIWAEARDNRVRIYVRDRGIGIAPEFLQKIFQPFQRLHGNDIPGSGIGLAIASEGAERMGGNVGVSSQPNEGSSFWVELNANVSLPAPAPEQVASVA